MRRIIINADGFGHTPGLNRGIYETFEYGLVKSTSCNVNFPYINEVSEIIKNFPYVSIGIHFNLSVGTPVTDPQKIPSLIQSNGEFWGNQFPKKLMTGKIKMADIETELNAQVKKLIDLGVNITHFDGHANHHLYPPFYIVAIKIAKKWRIKRMRTHNRYLFFSDKGSRKKVLLNHYIKNPKRFLTHFLGRMISKYGRKCGIQQADRLITPAYVDNTKKYFYDTWVRIFEQLPNGTNEIYCHPGYPDDILRRYSYYIDERKLELAILTDPSLARIANENNIEVISFHEL